VDENSNERTGEEMAGRDIILRILRNELAPSFGCTEPVAVGLATSIAYNAAKGRLPSWLGGQPTQGLEQTLPKDVGKIVVSLDPFTYRNGTDVEIPGTGKRGIRVAASLGVLCDPNKKLSLFEDSNSDGAEWIKRMLDAGRVDITVVRTRTPPIYIRARVILKTSEGYSGEGVAIIRDAHANVTYVEGNGRILYRKRRADRGETCDDMRAMSMLELEDIVDAVNDLPKEEYDLVRKSVEMNSNAAKVGMDCEPGLKIGRTLKSLEAEKFLGQGIINHAIALASAAVDARMSGCVVQVMSCAGSGNQGLTATLPIVAVAQMRGWSEERLTKSVALSFLITCYCTSFLGYLSTLCGGAMKAGVGASAGIAYYMGGNLRQVYSAMKNMIESIAGIICDGAKTSCAMKVAVISGAAVESAFLAMKAASVPYESGIKGNSLKETMKNLKKISDAMTEVDKVVLEIISS
jgi:L-cysteine desulfidase